jgi:hypothetical protein
MIKDAIANITKWPGRETVQAASHSTEIPSSIIHRVLKLVFASDVPLRGLHRSVAKEKLNLFQFASTTMAKARASAAKIVGCQIAYAGLGPSFGRPVQASIDQQADYIAQELWLH